RSVRRGLGSTARVVGGCLVLHARRVLPWRIVGPSVASKSARRCVVAGLCKRATATCLAWPPPPARRPRACSRRRRLPGGQRGAAPRAREGRATTRSPPAGSADADRRLGRP